MVKGSVKGRNSHLLWFHLSSPEWREVKHDVSDIRLVNAERELHLGNAKTT